MSSPNLKFFGGLKRKGKFQSSGAGMEISAAGETNGSES
jgi:hypothetical protein